MEHCLMLILVIETKSSKEYDCGESCITWPRTSIRTRFVGGFGSISSLLSFP